MERHIMGNRPSPTTHSLLSHMPSHAGLVGAALTLEQLAPHILADTPFDEFALAGLGGFVLGRFDEMRAGAAVISTKVVIDRCLPAFHVKNSLLAHMLG